MNANLDQDYILSLMGGVTPHLEDLLEGLTVWAHNTYGAEEVIAAREQFQLKTGKVFPDDPMHLARTAYFFDHFLFERSIVKDRITDKHLLATTPYEAFCLELTKMELPQAALLFRLKKLGDFRHSLFVIERAQPQSLVVKDIISKQKMSVSAKTVESFRALKASQVIQGFLYRFGDNYQLSPGIILHPPGSCKILSRFLRSLEKEALLSRSVVLAKLAHINILYLRLRHVDPLVTYKTELDAYIGSIKESDAKSSAQMAFLS